MTQGIIYTVSAPLTYKSNVFGTKENTAWNELFATGD